MNTPTTPYDEDIERYDALLAKGTALPLTETMRDIARERRTGYLRALQDMADYREKVQRLIEAAERFDKESPKRAPRDGSVDTLTYSASRAYLRGAIEAVRTTGWPSP
jgi:hypothetical protein